MPSRYSRRFDRGFFRSGRTLLYVSQGVAGKHPVRYGCPPEITRFTLRGRPRRPERPRGGRLGADPEGVTRPEKPGVVLRRGRAPGIQGLSGIEDG